MTPGLETALRNVPPRAMLPSGGERGWAMRSVRDAEFEGRRDARRDGRRYEISVFGWRRPDGLGDYETVVDTPDLDEGELSRGVTSDMEATCHAEIGSALGMVADGSVDTRAAGFGR